jgi:hypothetical protein
VATEPNAERKVGDALSPGSAAGADSDTVSGVSSQNRVTAPDRKVTRVLPRADAVNSAASRSWPHRLASPPVAPSRTAYRCSTGMIRKSPSSARRVAEQAQLDRLPLGAGQVPDRGEHPGQAVGRRRQAVRNTTDSRSSASAQEPVSR